jgi:CRP/FNR family transcriptional regulator, cyclic AMP receptor protein
MCPDLRQTPYGLKIVEHCASCADRAGGFFCDLSGRALRGLDAVRFAAPYPKGALLFIEGQANRGVHLLCAGRVKLSTTSSDARVIITRIAEPGEILGLCSALSGGPYEVTAETVEPCQVNFVRREDFLRFLSEHPDACLRVAEQLSRNYHAALEQVRMLGLSHSAACKFARFLLERGDRQAHAPARRAATPANGGGHAERLTLTLTHEEIGQLIGASRETVTRLFSEFKQDRLIQVKGSTLLLHDRPALEALANR